MKKTVAIIQARMGSTRLPGKVMIGLCGKPVLEHVITRIKQCKEINEIVIATTNLQKDDIIAEEAIKCGVKCFRGSEDDVLSRYYHAAKENYADIVVRITSDCPLIDPIVVDNMVEFYQNNNYDMVTNVGIELSQRTFPRGLDTEVFSFEVLEDAFINATENYQREHVTPYIYETSNRIYFYKNDEDYSHYRWTLDTPEDFQFIKEIYNHLYKGQHNFHLEDIIKLLSDYPELIEINAHVKQKKVK